MFMIDEPNVKKNCNEAFKDVLEIFKKYFPTLVFLQIETFNLVVYLLLHYPLYCHILIVFVISCYGPLVDFKFTCSLLTFVYLFLSLLLRYLLFIFFNCILK
jgi:hypothetical protein